MYVLSFHVTKKKKIKFQCLQKASQGKNIGSYSIRILITVKPH